MRRSAGKKAAATPDDGWSALTQGRWAVARAAFEATLAHAETAEALEGLSWAAWWLDDAKAVFDARERAFRSYRARGDAASAARMATWIAADQLDFHGAFAVATGWLQRARRLLEPLEPCPDHAWLFFHEGYIAFIQGDLGRCAELAERMAELARQFHVVDIEMLSLALEGAALVACGEVERGMRCLDEATATALANEATIPISGAWACCFQVTACESVRDFSRAFEWCDRIAEFSERYGSRYMLGFCRAHYGTVHTWRGEWGDAEKALHAAAEAYAQSRPAFVPGTLSALAELRRRQGRFEDAEVLLERAGAGPAHPCRARIALDRGDARLAAELAERFLRQTPASSKLKRVSSLECLIRARAECGELEAAQVALKELTAASQQIGTVPMAAARDVAAATVARAQGETDRARRLLEDAVDAFARANAPFERAQARLDLAFIFVADERRQDAAREAQASLQSFAALGADVEADRARALLDKCPGARESEPLAQLTRRERAVLRLLADGLTNRQIAQKLIVSEHTVHRHITNILRKLGLPTRAAAAAHAVRAGLSPQV